MLDFRLGLEFTDVSITFLCTQENLWIHANIPISYSYSSYDFSHFIFQLLLVTSFEAAFENRHRIYMSCIANFNLRISPWWWELFLSAYCAEISTSKKRLSINAHTRPCQFPHSKSITRAIAQMNRFTHFKQVSNILILMTAHNIIGHHNTPH
jgi:hypothetical protein